MSIHDYNISKTITMNDPPFYALIMAAMRKADDVNRSLLKEAFPTVWDELQARYSCAFGILPQEKTTP